MDVKKEEETYEFEIKIKILGEKLDVYVQVWVSESMS